MACTVSWPALWTPRPVDATWHAAWQVAVTPTTRLLDKDYDGSHDHSVVRVKPRVLNGSELPDDFSLGVVFGPSGSGKTSLLQELAEHYGCSTSDVPYEFPPRMAVCSHPGLGNESIDRLSCVGLNKIPSWMKPARVLSDGERQRVLTALSIKSKAVLDDFAVVVDDRNAASMAASLGKLVKSRGFCRVLVGTTKRSVLPFLAPDFIVFAETGVVAVNPWPQAMRQIKVVIEPEIEGFVGGKGGGWQGQADNMELQSKKDLGAGPKRTTRRVDDGSKPRVLEVSVDVDDACHEAADAFDYEFKGRTEQKIFELCVENLEESMADRRWVLGAIVGPSGTGKSCNMKRLSQTSSDASAWHWDRNLSVVDQLHHDKVESEKLALAAALPRSTALKPFHVLSTGERARAELARQLGGASEDQCVCLDEFTSCLDRTSARRVCHGISTYLRKKASLKVVVATVHADILPWLLPDWVMESDTGNVNVFDGDAPTATTIDKIHGHLMGLPRSLSTTTGLEADEVKELLRPPVLTFFLRQIGGCKRSRAAYESIFEEHHYLKNSTPTGLHGLVLRDSSNRPVAFHGIAQYVGQGCTDKTMRESRLVVLPEFQGFGLGPKLSNCVGGLLAQSGATITSRTAHPRLGAYRENHPELWQPLSTNRKALKSTMGSSLKSRTTKANFLVMTPVGDATSSKEGGAIESHESENGTDADIPVREWPQTTTIHVEQECKKSPVSVAHLLAPANTCSVSPSKPPPAGGSPDTSCRACGREQFLAVGRTFKGRPPKHTCAREGVAKASAGFPSTAMISPEVADVRPRVCFSHRFIGGASVAWALSGARQISSMATPQRSPSSEPLAKCSKLG